MTDPSSPDSGATPATPVEGYDRGALLKGVAGFAIAGYALYAYSQTAVAFVFGPAVALPGMLMLTIGDPVSGYLGSNDAGTAKQAGVLGVMFLVCFALAAPFTTAVTSLPVGLVAAAAGAAGATLADGVKPVVAGYVVDDNLSIPVLGAVAMWVGLLLVG